MAVELLATARNSIRQDKRASEIARFRVRIIATARFAIGTTKAKGEEIMGPAGRLFGHRPAQKTNPEDQQVASGTISLGLRLRSRPRR
jgi:hypothetical protein